MTISPISKTVARRCTLGRQGLWPGRRWAGADGTAQALRYIESVQMDPLNVIARSHDLALWGRVLEYQPDHLDTVMYRDRAFFDYGNLLRIYPMHELPYWRVVMRRRGNDTRWGSFGEQNRALLNAVKAALQARGPLGNRHFTGQNRVVWEVYKPAAKRRWGCYTMPVLYGDRLVARLDPKLDRAAATLVINGFWLEDQQLGKDPHFLKALARGLIRLAKFVRARHVVAPALKPVRFYRHVQKRVREGMG